MVAQHLLNAIYSWNKFWGGITGSVLAGAKTQITQDCKNFLSNPISKKNIKNLINPFNY
jgi:hypothetical protein